MSENLKNQKAAIPLSKGRMWAVLIALMLSTMMPCFAANGRATVLPTMMAELNGMAYYTLIEVLASLAMSITMPIAGKLGDLYGRRKLMLISQLGFIVSMLVICLGPNVFAVAAGVFLSGMFYGFLSPSVRAMVGEVCPPGTRSTFIGISTSAEYAGILLGPIVAGVFSDFGVWRGMYAVCIPVVLIASLIIFLSLPRSVDRTVEGAALDVRGTAAFLFALSPLLLVLNTTGTLIAKGSVVFWGCIALSAAGFVLLVLWEKNNPNAVIPLWLLKNGKFLRVFIVVFALMFSYITTVYYAVYIQNVRGLSATLSGTLLVPRGIVSLCMGAIIGWFMSKTGKYKRILVGEAVILVVYCTMFAFFDANTPIALFEIATLLWAVGYGGAITIGVSLAQDTVKSKDLGVASSLILFVDPFSYAVAAAAAGQLVNHVWGKAANVIPESLKTALSPEHYNALLNQATLKSADTISAIRGALPGDLQGVLDTTIAALREQLMGGIRAVCLMCLALAVVSLLMAFTLKEEEKKKTQPAA